MPKLNDRQRRFCELLVQGMSATEAAKQAGYAASTAGSNADKLLKNTNVSDYLAELRAELKDESIADARERAQFWTEVMRGKGSATFVTKEGLSEGPPDWGSRIKAAELLGKVQGDFDGEKSGPPSVVINMPSGPMTAEQIEQARRQTEGQHE